MYHLVGSKINFTGVDLSKLDKRCKNIVYKKSGTNRQLTTKNALKRHTKANRSISKWVLVKVLFRFVFSKRFLKIASAFLFVSWFLSTLEISYKPFNVLANMSDNKNSDTKTITNIDPQEGFTSADIPRDTVSRNGRNEELEAFDVLMYKESDYEAGRINKESLACGVGQAYPCTKLYPFATKDWILKNKIVKNMSNGTTRWYLPNPDREYEIQWAHNYIKGKYTTALEALKEWNRLKPCGLNKKKLCNYY